MEKTIKSILKHFSDFTNRAPSQTMFLYELCDRDFKKLILLEEQIKNLFLFCCPSNKEEIEKILAMKSNPWFEMQLDPKKLYFNLNEWRMYLSLKNPWTLCWEYDGMIKMIAVPPTSGDRRDLIDGRPGHDWHYLYDTTEEHKGLEINIINGKIILL